MKSQLLLALRKFANRAIADAMHLRLEFTRKARGYPYRALAGVKEYRSVSVVFSTSAE